MSSVTIDNRADDWPIVVSTFFGKEHTEAMINQAVDTWFEWRGRGKHVMIVDLTRGYAGGNAAQRAHMADRVRKRTKETDPEETKHGQVALILVSDSAVVRGLVTGVLWLVPTKIAPKIVGTFAEAVEMAVEELRKVGISVPPALAARARDHAAKTR